MYYTEIPLLVDSKSIDSIDAIDGADWMLTSKELDPLEILIKEEETNEENY